MPGGHPCHRGNKVGHIVRPQFAKPSKVVLKKAPYVSR